MFRPHITLQKHTILRQTHSKMCEVVSFLKSSHQYFCAEMIPMLCV